MTAPRLGPALAVAAAGGLLGSLARYGLTSWFEIGDDFPWTVFSINVLGSALLAGLPALAAVRRSALLGVFLGTGVLGGFTTMSAASAETVGLFERGDQVTGALYAVATLLCALLVVAAVGRLSTRAQKLLAEESEVDD